MVTGWIGDLTHAARALGRHPGFTGVALLTLTLGIGANTAVFSVVNGVLLEPLPYADPDGLVTVYNTAPGIGLDQVPLSQALYAYYRAESRALVDLAIYNGHTVSLTGGETPERVTAATTSWSLFRLLGVPARLGRTFVEGEDSPDAPPVAVLSQGLWRRSFGGDSSIVGRSVRIDGVARQVVGVMPAGFDFPRADVELWLPLSLDSAQPDQHDHSYPGIARLGPGQTVESARLDLERLDRRLPELFADEYPPQLLEQAHFAPVVETRKETVVRGIRQALWVLLGTVGFVLLIACANVANLFLVRGEGRQREVALRTALGATPAHVMRYYLSETMLLALGGGVLGLGLGVGAVRLLTALAPVSVPRMGEVGLDPTVLLFTAAATATAGILFGALPSFRYAVPDLVTSLKDAGRATTGGREANRARSALVVVQVALALVLLVGSSLMARSFWALRGVDPGFDTDGVVTARLGLPLTGYPTNRAATGFFLELVDRLEGLPGVSNAAAVGTLPLDGGRTASDLGLEGRPLGPDELPPVVDFTYVTDGYFAAMGIERVDGRVVRRADHTADARIVVVNRAFQQRFWPGEQVVGRRVNTASDLTGDWYTIVGVVGDARVRSLEEPPPPILYFPLDGTDEQALTTPVAMSIVVRASAEPSFLLPSIRSAVWALDPDLPLADARTMDAILGDAMSRTSFTLVMLGVASGVALLLGAVGVYGVISYTVSRRVREIGLRLALGARPPGVQRMVVRQGLSLAGIGVGLGLAGSWVASRVLDSLLFGVGARDVPTYVGVAVALMMTVLLASYLPARRASTVDPIEALRAE